MKISLLIILLLMPELSLAHARLKPTGTIPARSTSAGIKSGPCGGLARSANPKTFVAGSTITIDWEETINHPGRYEFYFSPANDTNWVLLKTVQDTQDTGPVPHMNSTTITFPNTACNACTIQMIQVMTENPAAPSNYYSCGDIQLTAASTPPPGPAVPSPEICP